MRFAPLEAAEGVAEPFSSTNLGNLGTEDPLGLFDFSNSGFSSTVLIPFGHSMLRAKLSKKLGVRERLPQHERVTNSYRSKITKVQKF